MSLRLPRCELCSRFKDYSDDGKGICTEYPEGIPEAAIWGDAECEREDIRESDEGYEHLVLPMSGPWSNGPIPRRHFKKQ